MLYLGQSFQPAVQAVAERRSGPSLDLLADLPAPKAADDPHFWLDPALLVSAVDRILGALAGVDGTTTWPTGGQCQDVPGRGPGTRRRRMCV